VTLIVGASSATGVTVAPGDAGGGAQPKTRSARWIAQAA